MSELEYMLQLCQSLNIEGSNDDTIDWWYRCNAFAIG